LGTMIGETSLAYLVSVIYWRKSIMLLGLGGLVISILSYQCIPNPKDSNAILKTNNPGKVFNSSKLWLHGIYIGVMFSPISVWASTWAIPYMMNKQNIELNR